MSVRPRIPLLENIEMEASYLLNLKDWSLTLTSDDDLDSVTNAWNNCCARATISSSLDTRSGLRALSSTSRHSFEPKLDMGNDEDSDCGATQAIYFFHEVGRPNRAPMEIAKIAADEVILVEGLAVGYWHRRWTFVPIIWT